MPTTKAHYTIVRNTSGQDNKFFSFLGERGAFLNHGVDYHFPGDLFDMWSKDTIQTAAIKHAIENGLIEIMKSPDLFFYDAGNSHVYRVGSNLGTIASVDPDVGSYVGSAPT